MLKFSQEIIKLVITVFLVSISVTFAQNDSLQNDLNKSFKKFDLVSINTQQAFVDSEFSKTIQIQTGEKNIKLNLQNNDLFSKRFRAANTDFNGRQSIGKSEIGTYKGAIEGERNSSVRLNITREHIEGFFVSNDTRYFIESAKSFSDSASNEDFIIYRLQDYVGNDEFECHSPIMQRIESGKQIVKSSNIGDLEDIGVLELATDADVQFVNELGGAEQANDEILFILNMVDGVFEEELKLNIQVVFQHTWSTPDPYTGATPEAVNNSFRTHWNANFPLNDFPRDAAHLFSAKSNVLSQGYAFIGAVCANPSFAYGISGRVSFQHGRLLLTSHELAHSVGGNHIDTSACSQTIMNTLLNGASPLEFCQTSRSEISGFINASGDCLAPPTDSSTRFDFDGDSKTDTAIYRPTLGQWWYLRSLDGENRAFQFGTNSDKMTPADYTGDGVTDLAFWRESTGEVFVLRSEDSSFYSFPFGTAGDIPSPADFDGDGIDDFAVFRPTTATWFILNSTGSITIQAFGTNGDIPVVNDYDGDGFADIAIFRPDVQQWWINRTSDSVRVLQFGATGDKPTPADFTGDGKVDVAFWRPATGEWFVVRSEDSSFYSAPFGVNTDIPTPGDFDGDGSADLAVWRPDDRIWYILGSQNGFSAVSFGLDGDIPVPSAYIP